MDNKLNMALNPAAYVAAAATIASGSSTNPLELQKQVEQMLASVLGGDQSVLAAYRTSLELSRSLTEQALLLKAAQCTDSGEALGWLRAANAVTTKETAKVAPAPAPRVYEPMAILPNEFSVTVPRPVIEAVPGLDW